MSALTSAICANTCPLDSAIIAARRLVASATRFRVSCRAIFKSAVMRATWEPHQFCTCCSRACARARASAAAER
jgi:hypothetical protein